MRPLSLELAGFSGFREPAEVSFEGADLIAFVGPTGSGKSSLIDAISFALYGSVARYDDRKLVEPAIHKLCNEARVRLDFEVGGARYTAVRVVRRTKTGGANTKEARLYRRTTDGGEETLAGTERELSKAIRDLLGLDFDQFTKTCVLPQGEFAKFLHDGKSERQDLLRQLLDAGLYARMGRLARANADQAATRAQLIQEQLDADPPMSDDELSALEAQAKALRAVAKRLPKLTAALAEVNERATDLAARRSDLDELAKRLRKVVVPPAVAKLGDKLADETKVMEQASIGLEAARDARDRARAAKDEGPDGPALERVLQAATRLRGHEEEIATLTPQLESAEAASTAATEKAETDSADAVLAEEARRRARDAEGLAAVIAELAVGEPCPVCRQTVGAIPEHDVAAELRAAEEAFRAAAAEAKRAEQERDRVVGERNKVHQRLDLLAEAGASLRAEIPEGTELDALRAQVSSAAELAEAYEGALGSVAEAEKAELAAKRTLAALEKDEARLRRELGEWRDAVMARRPPILKGTSIVADWDALADWAAAEGATVAAELTDATEAARTLDDERAVAVAAVIDSCGEVGVSVANPAAAGEVVAAEGAVVGQRIEHAKVRRTKAASAVGEIDGLHESVQLHRMLGDLLRVDGFERWLLQAALDRLVERATDRLLDLSGGQYSLVSDDGDFLVRDHRNADELRHVKTLSGGETFLTSLALALALSEDIAELATEGAPRIESMFLDEGFGTLDPDTLDVVATAIEELSASGRLIGIVTHLRDLADRVPVRFEVRKDQSTSRVERVEV